jgi:hypothetical protein
MFASKPVIYSRALCFFRDRVIEADDGEAAILAAGKQPSPFEQE